MIILATPIKSGSENPAPAFAEWTVEQKVGHLFMIGFPQNRIDEKLEAFIRKHHLGSFILFKRNLASTPRIRKLTMGLQRIAREETGMDALISVDQEGGLVSRLPLRPAMASGWALGQTGNPSIAYDVGRELGKYLRELGFNMNLSPVLDLGDERRPSFIGARALGSDPKIVAQIGYHLSRGLLEEKVLPTAKHFPGLGPIDQDPHNVVISRQLDGAAFKESDLYPFAEFSKLGPSTAVMASQLSYPFLDPTGVPTPFSKKILGDLLRRDLQYKGLVVTDDLQMKGSRLVLSPESAALESLKAGADLIMLTWSFEDQEKAIRRVVQAVRSGEFSETELHAKLARVLSAKREFSLARRSPASNGPSFTPKKWAQLDLRILDQNLISSMKGFLPPPARNEQSPRRYVCVYSPNPKFLSSFGHAARFPHRLIQVDSSHKISDLRKSYQDKNCSWAIMNVTGTRTARLTNGLRAKERKRWLLVNTASPHLTAENKGFLQIASLGFHHDHTGYRLAQILRGKTAARAVTASAGVQSSKLQK